MERNELLEVVAKRINSLILKKKKESPAEADSLSMGLEEAIKNEIERVFLVIRVNEWLDMCEYDDYKFFVKLYPKLEELTTNDLAKAKKLKMTPRTEKILWPIR